MNWADKSQKNRRTITTACMRDILYFVNAMVWTYDPRVSPSCLPFITYPFQDDIFVGMDDAIEGRYDMVYPKSRDQGLSWICMVVVDRRLLFRKMQSFAVVSRNEKYVDKKGDPDCLFWKLDFIHKNLPDWMTQGLDRNKLMLTNSATGSSIIGASTTGDVGRGGRKTAIILDEFAAFELSDGFEALASTQMNSRCRIFPSTPQGIGNAFYKIAHPPSKLKRHDVHWSRHPVQRAGLYKSDKGKRELLDAEYWDKKTVGEIRDLFNLLELAGDRNELALDHYGFILDGKLRSPHYDHECLRTPVSSLIAQEMDIDFIGSGRPFFDEAEIRMILDRQGCAPYHVGELDYDGTTYLPDGFTKNSKGAMLIWMHLSVDGNPPDDRRYVIGADISSGTGASNSCLTVGDCKTKEKVLSFVTARMRPERFAEYAFAVGKWFYGARIWFEGQGVGSDFGGRLQDLHYPALYWQKDGKGRNLKKPGWFSNEDAKRNLLTHYGTALGSGDFVNRDKVAVEEMLYYKWTQRGTVEHSSALAETDPSGAKKNHGDRVIADAGCWMLMKGSSSKPVSREKVAPEYCLASRRKSFDEDERSRKFW